MTSWNARSLQSIREQRKEFEKRYGIRLGHTEIYCAKCHESCWPNHICGESKGVRSKQLFRGSGIEDWRIKLGIELGMPKEEALDCFVAWREKQRTCQHCEGNKYIEFCDIHLICKEADNVINVARDDNRGRTFEAAGPQAVRVSLSATRERVALR